MRAAVAGTVAFAGSVAGRGVVSIDHGAFRTTYEPVGRAGRGPASGSGSARPIGTGGRGRPLCGRCLHWGLRRGETYLDPLLLIRPAPSGPLRLLAADRRAVAAERARERAEAAAAAAEAGLGGTATAFGAVGPAAGTASADRCRSDHLRLRDAVPPGAAALEAARRHRLRRGLRHPDPGAVRRHGRPRRTTAAAYGHRLLLAHGSVDGTPVTTGYNHATRYVVGPGDRVARGQLLGYVGSTGYSTGCHLHLMVWLDGGWWTR